MPQPAFAERPAGNVHIIYLRNNLPSADVMAMMEDILRDHGLTVKEKKNAEGLIIAASNAGKGDKKEVTIRTGRHAIKGNMVIMEYNKFIGEKVAMVLVGIAIAVVLVVVVVAIAGAAGGGSHGHSGSGSGGGHSHSHSGGSSHSHSGGGSWSSGSHHHHHHHHYNSSYSSGFFDGWAYAAIAPRSSSTTTVIVRTGTAPAAGPVKRAEEFKNRSDFFEYFFENCNRFFYNYANTRVPDEMAKKMKAIPLLSGEVKEGTIAFLDSDTFCIRVPDFTNCPIPPTLRVDLVGDGFAQMLCRKDKRPSRFTSNTVTSVETGKYSYTVSVGPNTVPPIQPGLWYISIINKNTISDLKYKVGWMLFEDTDKLQSNQALFGRSSSHSIEEDGDEWEVVDYTPAQGDKGKGKAKAKGMMSLHTLEDALEEQQKVQQAAVFTGAGRVVAAMGDPLTQDTDLLALDEARLRSELAMRGLPANMALKRELAAALWPALPPGPGGAAVPTSAPPPPYTPCEAAPMPSVPSVPSAPSLVDEGEEDEDESFAEMQFDAPVPHVYLCPITCELMHDPVMCSDGFSYDRIGIERWLVGSKISPMTGLKLDNTSVVPNHALKAVIDEWVAAHKKN